MMNSHSTRSLLLAALTITLAAAATACGDDNGATSDVGTAQIFVEPEDTIPEGLTPGEGEENIHDGWTVSYDKFIVTVGNFRASRSDASETAGDPAVHILDLLHAPAGGYVVAELKDISAVRWDRFGYDLPNAKAGAAPVPPTSEADAAFMIDNGYSVYFEGSMTKPDGQSCAPGGVDCVGAPKITFKWGLAAGTSYGDCASPDGIAGFAVPSGGTVAIKPTIHGDHWFFSNVTSGAEITRRYAQYIADSDLDRDGETTLDELKQVASADVFPASKYNLSGALGGGIATAYDYVLNQARSLGDFQGDGECPTRAILE